MGVPRRGILAGGAAMAVAATASAEAAAATGAAAAGAGEVQQAPGFYRFAVGDVLVTLVNDGVARRPFDPAFVRNAEPAAVQAALAAAFQPQDTITIPFTTVVLARGDRLTMIDAGTGGLGAPTAGLWMANFRAAGYAPEQVETIVVSHFHGDHIQGIRAKDGAAVFPRARVMVPEAEWAFWMDDGQMSRAPEGMRGGFEGVRRVFRPIVGEVERFSGEREVVPGLTAIPAPGHTPGHTAFVLADGDDRLLVWSDTTNKPELFVRNPGWQAVFDMDGDMAAATRRKMLDMAVSERLHVAGYHFPFPANGHIARDGSSYAFVPTFWQPSL
jgi:glyoxylase-like metal-dependent hydrolase (beta-lactamase superfamily II)